MARFKEQLEKFDALVTNPFGEKGAAAFQHLSNDPGATILYPNNARVSATTKIPGFPSDIRRALVVSSNGSQSGKAAVLYANNIGFVDQDSFTVSAQASGMANPSTTMFTEFDGGLYYVTPGGTDLRRFDINTSGNVSCNTTVGYTSAYSAVASYINALITAYNSNSTTDVYITYAATTTNPTQNQVLSPGTRIPFPVVSMDEYKNYVVMLCEYKTGAMVTFYDGKSSLPSFFEPVPQGIPLFVRNVNGYLLVVTFDKNVNSRTLIISVFDGTKFTKLFEYKKYNPSVFAVDLHDSGATVDDGSLYFTGRFCEQHGMWKFNVETNELTLESYYDNGGIATLVNYSLYNTLVLPSQIGLVMNTTGATLYQNDFNNYSVVSPMYITRRFDGGAKNIKKKWLSVGLTTHTGFDEVSSIPANRSILVEYRIDNTTAWTTMGTHTASNEVFTEFTYENTQITITDYHTIQFKLTWTGLSYLDDFYVTHDGLPEIEN